MLLRRARAYGTEESDDDDGIASPARPFALDDCPAYCEEDKDAAAMPPCGALGGRVRARGSTVMGLPEACAWPSNKWGAEAAWLPPETSGDAAAVAGAR